MASASADILNQLSAQIIGLAIGVHREIGPGLLESAYLGCLCYELHAAGLVFELQKPIPLRYRNVTIDCAYRADLIVERSLIVEVKALESMAPIHSRQLLTYLRLAACPLGLILPRCLNLSLFRDIPTVQPSASRHRWLHRLSEQAAPQWMGASRQ